MTGQPESNLGALLRSMQPHLNEGIYVYASVPASFDLAGLRAIASFREAEGVTLILREEEAHRANLKTLFRAAWITLTVHSDLQAVGLTAAFAGALGKAGISCNVVAAAYHDHIFVPVESAENALAVLYALQEQAESAASEN